MVVLVDVSRLGVDVFVWTVAFSVAGVCSLGLWQLRSGQWFCTAIQKVTSLLLGCLRYSVQQVARSMPAWTGLQGYGDSQTSIGEDRIIRMLPFVCLGDSGLLKAVADPRWASAVQYLSMLHQHFGPGCAILACTTSLSGKTFLLHWLCHGQPPRRPPPTYAADLHMKCYKDEGCLVQLWDVGGRLQSSYLKPSFFRLAAGVVLVYDARNPLVLESLDFWYQSLLQKCGCGKDLQGSLPPIVVVGNLKVDAPPAHLLEVKSKVTAWCHAHGNLPHKLVPLPCTLVGMEWAIWLLLRQALNLESSDKDRLPVLQSSPISSPRLAAQKAPSCGASKPPRGKGEPHGRIP